MRINELLESTSEIVSLGTIVQATISNRFLTRTFLFIRQPDGWQKIEKGDSPFVFSLLPDKVESLDRYRDSRIILLKGPKFGELIKAPIQIFGFPEQTRFVQNKSEKKIRYIYRAGDQIEYNGKLYDISAVKPNTARLDDPAFR